MIRNFTWLLYITLLILSLSDVSAQQQNVEISFERAVELMNDSKGIRIADLELDWAESERQRLNALWFPQISAAGAYVYFGNKIEVKESLSTFTDPAKDFIHSIPP